MARDIETSPLYYDAMGNRETWATAKQMLDKHGLEKGAAEAGRIASRLGLDDPQRYFFLAVQDVIGDLHFSPHVNPFKDE